MATTTKFKLDFEIDFKLVALLSNVEDYKLCWLINQKLDYNFERTPNLILENKSKPIGFFSDDDSDNMAGHIMFSYIDQENLIETYLIANTSNSGYLVPEQKQFNFLLLFRGYNPDEQEYKKIISLLTEMSEINNVLEVDCDTIKNINALLF